jgi:hypothetical protein
MHWQWGNPFLSETKIHDDNILRVATTILRLATRTISEWISVLMKSIQLLQRIIVVRVQIEDWVLYIGVYNLHIM